MRTTPPAFSAVGCLLLVSVAASGPYDLPSGPAVGSSARSFKVAVITGPKQMQTLDYVADRGEQPTVYLFVQDEHWSRPVARFVRTLDARLRDTPGAEAVAIWLGDNPEKSARYLPQAQLSLQLERTPLTVFEGPKSGPDGWSINDQAHLTAVAVRGGKVVASFGYESVEESEVQRVIEALSKP